MEDRGEDGYAIVADYMASLTTANEGYRLRELKMSGRSPLQLEPLREVLRRHACLGLP